MSITSQNLLTNSNSRISFYIADTNVAPLKNPNLFLPFSLKPLRNLTRCQILNNPTNSQSFRTRGSRIRVFQSEGAVQRETGSSNLNLDSILSVVEFLCLASSAIVSVGLAVNSAVSNPQKSVLVVLGNKILLWQAVALVGGVVVGSWIRRRQWRRICKDTAKPGNKSVNLVERMEKMEEDVRSLATLIRVMSRQLEKLGIRFRVTRKALKQPIAETAALAQKNSEATRALAVQEDILEKELGEIQKVLLAMQEQQQKQLELILAIGKAGKLWENRRGQSEEQDAIETCDSTEVEQMKTHQIPAVARQMKTHQNTFPLSLNTRMDIGNSETDFEDMAMIGMDAMQSANSTLADFCRSYFMFHGMDVNTPQSIFRYLPVLSFTESYIYQLDTWNEKMLHIPTNGNTVPGGSNVEKNQSAIIKLMEVFKTDPFRPLVLLFEHHGILTERIREELRCGEEYWDLERKLCTLLLTKNKVSMEEVMRAIHLKSFDYRVLNLLLYQLRGAKVNDLHMEFLSISEFLVEVSDDLFDYEDDVLENNFNILRMFVRIYGASTAQTMLAKCISEAEEKYNHLLKTLDPQLSLKYQRRCEEATKEGGRISGHALGTWSMPPVIVDEDLYRSNVLNSRSTIVPPDRHSLE